MTILKTALILSTVALISCSAPASKAQTTKTNGKAGQPYEKQFLDMEEAIIAGGCFWCVESDFEKLDGVIDVVSGYSGGTLDNPSYNDVTAGGTGHYEVAQIIYDPAHITYRELIDHYWETVDPTDSGGQFCDRGDSYRTAIFATPYQMDDAEESKEYLQLSGRLNKPIITPILPAVTFYPAEDYHQNYYKKKPVRYKYYRNSCGRDRRLKALWGAP
ncbi:MAG: peptide-methionine (S)-S-oxide reductase MsrA [Robiginitomaculum sp.]